MEYDLSKEGGYYSCNKCENIIECSKDENRRFNFKRLYHPNEYLHGKTNSEIWIVGLNPANDIGFQQNTTTKESLSNFFDKKEHKEVKYLKDFKKVSSVVYERLGDEYGTAVTDLVKCSSKTFPNGGKANSIVDNCKEHLEFQINKYRPRVLVCNGSPVSNYVRKKFPPTSGVAKTSYWTEVEGVEVFVVLSGFVGRIDNYARKRLGLEIETGLEESKKRRP